mmetsp:Transcript_2499/g.5551  ORF Transcript_2499/g.5551 Transcript_2499/m.5551 type:complete len:439 (+) Transcript_2499:55-1371(+)
MVVNLTKQQEAAEETEPLISKMMPTHALPSAPPPEKKKPPPLDKGGRKLPSYDESHGHRRRSQEEAGAPITPAAQVAVRAHLVRDMSPEARPVQGPEPAAAAEGKGRRRSVADLIEELKVRRASNESDEGKGGVSPRWAARIAQLHQGKLSEEEKGKVHKRAEQIRSVQRARAKCHSIAMKGENLGLGVQKHVGQLSVMREKGADSGGWSQASVKANTHFKTVSSKISDDEEVKSFVKRLDAGERSAADAAAGGCAGNKPDPGIRAAIQEFKGNPATEEESACKFAVYEAWAAAALSIRDELHNFVRDNAQALGSKAAADMAHQLQGIDAPTNMRAPDGQPGVWFVYAMAKQVCKNMEAMTHVLHKFEGGLQRMGESVECPVCLEPFAEGERRQQVLACCHTVCRGCWKNIRKMPPAPLCPICRQGDFIKVLSNSVDL